MPIHEIIHPGRVEYLPDYCSGKKGIIKRCLGLGRDYCPRSCHFAVKKDLAGIVQEIINRKRQSAV
jgi:hypothetical protein